jgi:hypothetical protein
MIEGGIVVVFVRLGLKSMGVNTRRVVREDTDEKQES